MRVFDKIYAVVATIPKGRVMTYGQVAKLTGITNPRVVGFAMRSNKAFDRVPCHRVVGKNGQLTGYARGGVLRKKEMLEQEGIVFMNTNTIDIKRYL